MVPGSHILGCHSGNRSRHGRGHQKQETDDFLHNAHRGGHTHPSGIGNGRNHQKGNLDQSLLEGNGNPNGENSAYRIPFKRKVLSSDLYAHRKACQRQESHPHAQSLGCHRSQSCTCGPHGEGTDEHIIQHNVEHTGDGHKVHGALCIPQSPEDAADDIVGNDERNPRKADKQIPPGLLIRLRRYSQKQENPVQSQQKQHRRPRCRRRKQGHGIPDAPRRSRTILCPHRMADRYRGTHRKAHDDYGQHVHYLASHRHGGDGACPVVLPGDEHVRQTVKGLQEARHQIRPGKPQKYSRNISLCQILLHSISISIPFFVQTVTL